ncbi:MAG: NAD-dependent epimerase/dehydratase family protein [Actinobacteria bacterium]|nr:NAD-dependent epimerase/dehydratase family protein [Actinomycetota bacterium]
MKILITGGAGFIGSHTTELFVEDGHDVTVVDNFSSGSLSNLDSVLTRINIVDMDICDATAFSKVCRDVEIIIHLAAVSSVEKSIIEPLETHNINTAGIISVMEAARENKTRRVVFSSSAAVYGNDPELPKIETSLTRPQSPYAWHKLTGEFYGGYYQNSYGVEFLALRYFNVYGSRQDPGSPYSGVLSIFSSRCRNGEPLTIFGNGEQSRDFIHVSDIAKINLLAASAAGKLPGIINVSTGRETRIIDVARMIQSAYGTQSELVFEEQRPGDIDRSWASTNLLTQTFGYEPVVDMKKGLADLIRS